MAKDIQLTELDKQDLESIWGASSLDTPSSLSDTSQEINDAELEAIWGKSAKKIDADKVASESIKTNEWGEPIYPFEKPVEVEGARLNDFLTPTIFEPKPNAKSEAEPPKKAKEEKPYNPEGLLPITEPGQTEIPPTFISSKIFEEFTPEEKLMLDVDKATDNAFNAAQEEASAQSVKEDFAKTPWQRAFEDDTYDATKNQVSLRKTAGADAVIKRTFESISADDINTIIENKVANNEEFKAKKQAFDDEVKRIMPNSNDNLSDAEVEALFANMTPEEREVAEKQIADTTQALEALQTQFVTDVEGIYKSESKDVEAQINNRIINRLAKLNLPKNDLEYIGKAIYNNSLVGTLYEIGLNAAAGGSGTDYIVSQQALAQAKPSAIAKVVGGAGAILADGVIFGALSAGGSLAGAGLRSLATRIVAGQIARKAAVSATNSAVKATARRIVEKNVLQQFASAATAQAATLGGYNGLLTAAQETLSPTGENGAYNWRNILTRFGEGFATGIALGGVSVGTAAAKGAMYRARPDMAYTFAGQAADLGIGLAGFTAENAAFLGIGSIVSGEEITAEAIGESFATLGLLKGIGALKRVAKGEKLMQQPDFVQRTISDLNFTKEEMDAMRKAGVDMSQIDIVSEAVREVLNTPNKSQIPQETISSRPLMDVYNSVMASREVPLSAKIKLQYIVKGTVTRDIGATSLTYNDANGVPTVKAYDANTRLVQIREFESKADAESFMKKTQPLLERNSIIEGEKVLRGGQIAVTIQQAIEQYAKENPEVDARTLFTELMIDLGYAKGEVPASSRERVETIKSRIKEQFVDPASQLVDGIARQFGTDVESVYRALNIKPDLRTVRESQLVKAYVDGLKQFNESMSGPVEAEQARYAEQVRPQIEQGKREIEDAERETAFVRESLNEAAKRMATADGKQIAIVRLENGEQVAVHTGRIVLREDGTIDHKASEQTIVIKRIDAEGNEQRDSVGIDDIAEVIEQGTPEEAVETSMSVLEAQATKKLSLDKALSENGEQGVEVVTIDGNSGKIVGIDENGAYILRAKVESGKEVDVPVSINDIEAINAEQPATTEQAAVADAVEKVVEDAATVPVEVEYDDDFPPLTEADMAPQLDADKIQWDKLTPEDYTSASAMLYGDATTLADSHIYHTNSRAKLAKAKQSVAEQQAVIDKLNSRFATMSSPAEAQKLRKQVATAEQEKAKREQAVKNIEEQMAKYAHAMRKYGVEVATEDSLLAERARLEEERNALLEADKELDRFEQEATKGKKAIANTAANRKYIEQLYADRFGVSPAQAGPRQAILWDLANGAIKLRWDNVTTDSGAVQKGLAAELGLSAAEKRIYKAVTDNKNGQSVDAYVHDLWQGAEWGQEVDDMTLKDMALEVLQSTPNGSIALKELADMSGVQADLEAQISLGKGDIQRKLEAVDANLAKNAQQIADFRKRINDTVQKLERGEQLILPVGEGEFGPIYDQFKGKPQEAVDFLLAEKNGEAIGALSHKDIGEIDLVWGKEGTGHSDGYGLSKLAKYHPEVLDKLQPILDDMEVVSRNANRVNLESPKYQAAVRLTWNNERKNWLLTAFEKRNSAIDNTTDTGETAISGKQNDTATLQSTASENKDTTSIPKNQISEEEFFGNAPIGEDIPFMIEQETADKGVVSEAEQNFNREVIDAFAGHLGETLGAESVVTDAAEAQRVLEWHQAVGERLRTAVRENAEIAAERAEIERVAKENGTWLKAPNGKDTNLTERQWVDVHTSRFKSWFGDWDKMFIKNFLLNKTPIARLSGNEFLRVEGKTLTEQVAEYFESIGGKAISPLYGEVILDRKGADDSLAHGMGRKKAVAYASVKEVIESGVLVQYDTNHKGRDYDTAVFAAPIEINNERHICYVTIKRGKYNRYYLHEVWTEKNLANVGSNAVQGQPSQVQGVANILQNIIFTSETSSKVVDDNGVPKVVYHGTPNQFNTFNRELIGSSTDRGIWGRGFYFTSNKAEAERYTKRGDATGEVKEVFLNIRKPLAIKAEQGDAGKEYIQGLYRKHVTDEIFEDPRTTDAKLAEATQKVTDELVENGYDGVVVTYKDGTKEYVVFNPNQIKSATENTGEYNPANDDIRMSIEAYHGSGADFEKFDHKFMGTGEGAQAFGWGTYVTEVENIARGYAKASGEVKERKERELAKQTLLIIRENIAKERMSIDRTQKELAAMEEHYAKLEDDLQATIFPRNRKRLQETMEELANDIRNAKGEIESSLFQIEQLKPQEEQFAKVWEQFDAPRKIAEKEQHIEWNRLELVTLNRKLEKFENALDSLKHSGKMGDELVEDLIAMTNLRYELEGKDEKGAQEALIAEINRVKKIIEGTERGISIRQKEIEELQAIEQPKFRNLYSVEVPDNTGGNYLPWADVLTSEIAEKVYPKVIEALQNWLDGANGERWDTLITGWNNIIDKYKRGEERSGEQVYHDLTVALRSDKAASELLYSLGFTGIEYPAQYTTGGRADGAKNYVIFNADDVQIVDHVQYFKTPNGEVYGFVYEDKIYLDPTNIDPKAPVHEYTELWCREVAKANEALWKRGKELVKQTKVWEEVNADENYKNQSEDLRASEAWSRIIADEMMGKARQYGSKGLMAKLRGWLRSFWKTVKSVVGKWTKKDLDDLTVEQFKKMTMADFINKVDPRKWNAKKPKEVSKSLVGIHNISLDKLQKALKQGGLANPSVGVIDIAKQSHDNYGEYSFILPKNLVDAKRTKGNAGTFIADAWTPVYPQVHKRYSTDKGSKAFWRDLQTLPKEMHLETRNGFESWKEGRNSNGLAYMFLFERGKAPEMVRVESKYPQEIKDRVGAILGEGNNSMYNLSREEREQLLSIYIDYEYNGDRALFDKKMARRIQRINEVLGREDVMQLVKRRAKMDLESINEYGYDYDALAEFVRKVATDIEYSGTVNDAATNSNALSYITDNNLTAEFESWKESLADRYDIKEYLFAGYTASGRERWIPNTIENASNLMNKEGLAGATGLGANFGHFVASIIKPVKSLDEIRENKSKFVTDDKAVDEFREKWTPIFFELGEKCQPDAGGFADYGLYRLTEAAQKSDLGAYLKKEYGIELSKEDLNKLSEMITAIKETFPARYFETKFQRPVMFNEFAAVVAPNTIPESVEQQLRDAGLAIYKYNPDVEGDRRKATLAATASEDIRFMIVGEKGAANLDAMEEATTRLDNLAVAREMEGLGKDASTIRLATGWERGADGKWRYEIGDAKIKDTKDVGGKVVARWEDDMLWNSGKLGEIVVAPQLFEAYPQLRNVRLDTDALPTEPNNGTYYPSTRSIKINADNIATLNSILNHEIQHAIQHIEGFASGSNLSVAKKEVEELSNKAAIWRFRNDIAAYMREHPDTYPSQVQKKVMELYAMTDGLIEEGESLSKEDIEELEARGFFPFEDGRIKAFNLWARGYDGEGYEYAYNLWRERKIPTAYERYKRTIGETEARNVQKRMRMTPEERRATLLSETEDVAREDQIFLENNLGVAQNVEISEPVEAPTRKPRRSKEEKLSDKVEELKGRLNDRKKSLDNTLIDIYTFLTSPETAKTMGAGVGVKQYRSVIKESIEAIRKAYGVTDPIKKAKIIDEYRSKIDDSLSQLLSRQRLNEVTDILDTAIYGYTAHGVRTGKRIDEHTREIFDILRNAIGEPIEEERTEDGRRKPVRYRLKNRTEDGDITSSFRLRTSGDTESIIKRLRREADEIIDNAEELTTEITRKAVQLEYTANVIEKYDNALMLNETIGYSTEEINRLNGEIERIRQELRGVPAGTEERKNLQSALDEYKRNLTAEQQNRANLRHRYAAVLKTFTTTLEQLDEKGAAEFAREELAKAEERIKWRKGIYDSVKNPEAPALPVEGKNRKGEEQKINWKGLNTRAKINESDFMATFAEMSRDIDINSIPGQWNRNGWYYQFMLAPGGYMERTDWLYKTKKSLHNELDEAVVRFAGKSKFWDKLKAVSGNPLNVLATAAQKPSGLVIQRVAVNTNKDGKVVGGYQENVPLTIGQILYMRNAIRQPNGMAGYTSWGFSESWMQNVANYAETNYPEYCKFFDWVVGEFMPKLYDMQDAIYFKKFGTHLSKTAFYFPFVRDKRMVGRIAEVGEGEVSLPSSVTGNIVERVKTSAKMDLSADAFKVLHDHMEETLNWVAYAEIIDKFNNIATSHAFINILKAQGVSQPKLKERFEFAVGRAKINSTDNTTLTKVLNAASKGLVAGNIVANLNAAAKQIVSGTATLGYTANPKIIPIWAKNFFVPSAIHAGVAKIVQKIKSGEISPVEVINWKLLGNNWKWAIKNIPTLRERWEGRDAGFEVMKSHSWETWDKITSMLTSIGLSPNAFVDMMTCSNAARTVYEYEYPRLLERGRSKEEAHRVACVKAAVFVNETQQSSLNGFLSSFQSGSGLQRILGSGFNSYQNSSMAFARNERFAATNMLRMLKPSTKGNMVMRQVEAYKADGLDAEKAVKLANNDFNESYGSQASSFIHNAVLNNYIWAIAGAALTPLLSAGIVALFKGGDEWDKVWKNEKFRQELATAVSAETLVWQVPLLYNAPGWKQTIEFLHALSDGKHYSKLAQSPSAQEIEKLLSAVFQQWIGVKNEITGDRKTKEPKSWDRSAEWLAVNALIKAGLGVNPNIVMRMAEGIQGMIEDGVQAEDVMQILSSPRGLTRAIAGEPRKGESKKDYLDRMSYIYRQVNAGSGEYDKKFVSERTKEYIDNKDNELYRQLGIVPREVRILEQRVKAIRKQLLFFDKSDEGIAEFRALPETDRKKQIEIAKRYDKITKLTKEMYQGILPFDEAGVSKRKQALQKRHDMMREVYDMWIEYNNK